MNLTKVLEEVRKKSLEIIFNIMSLSEDEVREISIVEKGYIKITYERPDPSFGYSKKVQKSFIIDSADLELSKDILMRKYSNRFLFHQKYCTEN